MFLSNTYLCLVRLATTWGKFCPVYEPLLVQRNMRLNTCPYISLDGADPAYSALQKAPAKRIIRYSKGMGQADPARFSAQFFSHISHRCCEQRQLNLQGFQVAENCGAGVFFVVVSFSLSLKLLFLFASCEPENLRKACFRHINTQCFQNEICSPDAAASQRN